MTALLCRDRNHATPKHWSEPMNAQTSCICALVDLRAGLDQVIEHLNRQNWAPYHHTIAGRIPAIRNSVAPLISDIAVALDAIGNAGMDVETNAMPRLKAVIADAFDDEFESGFSEMEETAELAMSERGRAEDRADDAYQAHREAAE